MPKFVVEYGSVGKLPEPDGRLDGPAFHRNHDAIWSAMAAFMGAQTGDVLEVGSGTGQHVTEFARRAPQLTWWPSDITTPIASRPASPPGGSRRGLANLRSPQRIDLTDADWTWQRGGAGGALTAILCINVLHISPWACVAKSHGRRRAACSRAGAACSSTARSSATAPTPRPAMPHSMPACGRRTRTGACATSRELNTLAQAAGLSPAEITPMPANNLVLAFARDVRHN